MADAPGPQDVGRAKLRALIAAPPAGRTKTQEKVRIGRKLLDFSGKPKNIARSVDRLVMYDRESAQARNFSSAAAQRKKQLEAINRSYGQRFRGAIQLGDGEYVTVTDSHVGVLGSEGVTAHAAFLARDKTVWEGALPRIVIGSGRGLVAARVFIEFRSGGTLIEDVREIYSKIGPPRFGVTIPFSATFGFLSNPKDLSYLWDERIRIMVEEPENEAGSEVFRIFFNRETLYAERPDLLDEEGKPILRIPELGVWVRSAEAGGGARTEAAP